MEARGERASRTLNGIELLLFPLTVDDLIRALSGLLQCLLILVGVSVALWIVVLARPSHRLLEARIYAVSRDAHIYDHPIDLRIKLLHFYAPVARASRLLWVTVIGRDAFHVPRHKIHRCGARLQLLEYWRGFISLSGHVFVIGSASRCVH